MIIANFKNTGEKEVDAQFKGKITRGNEIIQLLESEIEKVPRGQTNDFNFYFTPEKSGEYIISGRVYYSSKKTFESSTEINVISKEISLKSGILLLVYVLLILSIFYLIFKIRKERVRFSRRIRRIRNAI